MSKPQQMSGEEVVSARWTLPILRALLCGPMRFSRLREAIPGVSAKMLADRLRTLEEGGIVERVQLPEPANRQIYRLTVAGLGIRGVLEALDVWSRHIQCEAIKLT